MKKIILFITILFLTGLVLVGGGCGNGDENGENGEKEKNGEKVEEGCEDVPDVYLEYCEWYLSQVETDQSGTYSWNTPCACAKKHAQGEKWRWDACLDRGDPEEWCIENQELGREIYRDCIGSSDPKCGVGL